MKLEFTKMEGAGNDYIYINGFKYGFEERYSELSERLSDRHFGIGGDGLIAVMPSDVADVRMAMYNADGSEGAMCGNGIRCAAKFAYEKGLSDRNPMSIETRSGIKIIELFFGGDGTFARVDMGPPSFNPADIGLDAGGKEFIDSDVKGVNGEEYRGTAVSMGNPHFVIFVPDVSSLELDRIGPPIENAPAFRDRVNTEFVKVASRNTLEMRVWERGSGETLACGTGACATVVAAVRMGYCGRGEDIRVRLLGGELVINWSEEGSVFMTGPATTVFTGEVEI